MEAVYKYYDAVESNKSILYIPFEKFVLAPEDYMISLEDFLGAKMRPATKKILKKQRVPRPSINAGPQKSIYKRYALKKYDKNVSHEEDYKLKWESAKENCSAEAFEVVERMSKQYEETFGLWF